MNKDFETLQEQTSEDQNEPSINRQLVDLEEFIRDRRRINFDPVLGDETKPSLHIADHLAEDESVSNRNASIIDVSSLRAEHSAFGSSLRAKRIRKQKSRKKAA
ncbi:hypothetical protein A3G14_04165 [Candidatus Curtissbacteria bacterium RIFCSPLOWO2_12_FULL_38_9]|uniref:Uncharacterized protein n=1 Tax=Candidatus Curtissbacteria bacterium RIFCSPLOWO2_12_FULL_38_9 TaxID=1797735 RepID=A0A1F5I774_9BACT|nr:MAG: hypothetical protein A3G14_04165 [Candidatus Curtissbacteria bacterium RIFCSPLOWO2_12_FULL_38_9]